MLMQSLNHQDYHHQDHHQMILKHSNDDLEKKSQEIFLVLIINF
jgi:hypothetical protein